MSSQVTESDDSKVVLERADLDTEGKYGCEITTDYPFETVLDTGNVTVVGEEFVFRFEMLGRITGCKISL